VFYSSVLTIVARAGRVAKSFWTGLHQRPLRLQE
jgi:hypothetical protein